MYLQVNHGLPYPLVRARKPHRCNLCDDVIPVGMLHQVWTWFERGELPIRLRGHDLCVKSEIVETFTVGRIDFTSVESIGIDSDGLVHGEKGAEDWWALVETLAPYTWWGTDCSQAGEHNEAYVWPPNLHGWLISLPPIEWSL